MLTYTNSVQANLMANRITQLERMLDEGKTPAYELIVELDDGYGDRINESYARLSEWESSNLYIRGSSQSMTWILHYLNSMASRDEAAWSKRGEQDAGALAPTNLTSSRIVTLLEAPRDSRMALRFRLGMVYSALNSRNDDVLFTERLQWAALFALPKPILTREDHRRYWINYDADAMSWSGQLKWPDIRVTVRQKGFFVDSEEIWIL